MLSRNVLAILVVVATFSLGESFFFMKPSPTSGGGKTSKVLVATKTKTTVTRSSFSLSVGATLNGNAEAGNAKATGSASFSASFKGTHNSCGCGGDNCVKYTKCKIPGWNPVCCNNKCKCVQKTAKDISAYFDKTCKMCSYTFSVMLCRDATMTEFNCWTNYAQGTKGKGAMAAAEAPAAPEATFQYAYFRK